MNRARPKQIVVRASESEFKTIKDKVSKSKINQNEYLLRCLLDKNIIVVDGVKELITEIKRIGNNLNQLTRLAHEGKTNGSVELEAINKELKGVWRLLRQLIQKEEVV